VKLNFIWKEKTLRYQNGERLYMGRICVGQYEWNSTRSRSDKSEGTRYIGRVLLPSLKKEPIYGAAPEDIKTEVERVVTVWFEEALKEG